MEAWDPSTRPVLTQELPASEYGYDSDSDVEDEVPTGTQPLDNPNRTCEDKSEGSDAPVSVIESETRIQTDFECVLLCMCTTLKHDTERLDLESAVSKEPTVCLQLCIATLYH